MRIVPTKSITNAVTATAEARDKSFTNMLVSAASAGVRFVAPLVPGPVRQLVGAAASAFGFDMPRSVAAGSGVYMTGLKDFPAGSGVSHATVISRFPDARAATVFAGSGHGDEMELARMAATFGHVGDFTLTSASVPFTTVFSVPVNPKYCYNSGLTWNGEPVYTPTPAALASQPFARWRGTMRYHLSWSCSGFHNARVRVYFVPGREDDYIPPVAPALAAYNALVEIAGPGETTVDVPFCSQFPYAAQSIGRLCVQVDTPPSEIGDVVGAPIYVTVLAALADAEFVDFSNVMFQALTRANVPVPTAEEVVAQGRLSGGPTSARLGVSPPVHIGGGPYTPEVFTHVSQIIHAPALYGVAPNPSGVWRRLCVMDRPGFNVINGGAGVWYTNTDVFTGAPSGSAIAIQDGLNWVLTDAGGANAGMLPAHHFAAGYYFWTGGQRLHVAYNDSGTAQPPTRAFAVPYPPALVGIDSTGFHGLPSLALPGGPVHEEAGDSDIVQVEVPYVNGATFVPTTVLGDLGTQYADYRSAWTGAACIMTQRGTDARVYASTSDDFRFVHLAPPPPSILVRGGYGDGTTTFGPWAAFYARATNWHAVEAY